MTCHVSPVHLGEYLPYQKLIVEACTDLPEARKQQELAIPICGMRQRKGHVFGGKRNQVSLLHVHHWPTQLWKLEACKQTAI